MEEICKFNNDSKRKQKRNTLWETFEDVNYTDWLVEDEKIKTLLTMLGQNVRMF